MRFSPPPRRAFAPSGWVALPFALGLLLSGCRPAGDRGSMLVAALTTDASHLNPAITTAGGVHTVAALVLNGLVSLDEDSKPVPEFATRWTVEEERRPISVHAAAGRAVARRRAVHLS